MNTELQSIDQLQTWLERADQRAQELTNQPIIKPADDEQYVLLNQRKDQLQELYKALEGERKKHTKTLDNIKQELMRPEKRLKQALDNAKSNLNVYKREEAERIRQEQEQQRRQEQTQYEADNLELLAWTAVEQAFQGVVKKGWGWLAKTDSETARTALQREPRKLSQSWLEEAAKGAFNELQPPYDLPYEDWQGKLYERQKALQHQMLKAVDDKQEQERIRQEQQAEQERIKQEQAKQQALSQAHQQAASQERQEGVRRTRKPVCNDPVALAQYLTEQGWLSSEYDEDGDPKPATWVQEMLKAAKKKGVGAEIPGVQWKEKITAQ